MNILYLDEGLSGHHKTYLESLINSNDNNNIYVMLPSINYNNPKCKKIYTYENIDGNFKSYIKMIKMIKNIVKQKHIDIVHILTGDILYRFLGIGLKGINCKVIATFHHIRRSRLRDFSIKRIFNGIDKGVVHTKSLLNLLNKEYSIKNVIQVEYPYFGVNLGESKIESRAKLGIKTDLPILGCIGGTREDKGLDVMLDALNKVQEPFYLLVAGAEESITSEYINNHISLYKKNTYVNLKFLSDEELYRSINAVDYIVLPYRKIFDGASGPLTEGVALGKAIIGPNHGSLGQIINDNHLGYTFEAENVLDLAKILNVALKESFVFDTSAANYKEELKEEKFRERYNQIYKLMVGEN